MKTAVIGAGAWGTALACQLRRNGHDVSLWFRDPEKAELAHAEKQARLERDARWGEAHCNMTDEELLSYLRQCALELGHTPYSYEVVGGKYLSQRFGGWGMAIYRAGLPELKGVKGPTAAERAAICAEINGCQPGRNPEAYRK